MRKICIIMGMLMVFGYLSYAIGECGSSRTVFQCRNCGRTVEIDYSHISGQFADSISADPNPGRDCPRSRDGRHDWVKCR